MTVLFVTPRVEAVPNGGRGRLSKIWSDALRALRGSDLDVVDLSALQRRRPPRAAAVLRGHIDGVDRDTLATVLLRAERAQLVVLDGSNLGAVARELKRRRPGLRVATLLHNVEARFFEGAFRSRPSLHAAGVAIANRRAERDAVRSSDALVCLSEVDRRLLGGLYGREGTHVCPMAVEDIEAGRGEVDARLPAEPYALFVGGAFYANVDGIAWYARHVAPHAPILTVVVGQGLEAQRTRLEGAGLRVVGSVAALAPWYRSAKFVVAPIHDGSGMKTKVAEALMFGKRVVGTPQAFVGYEVDAAKVGAICADADSFRAAVAREALSGENHSMEARAVYEKRYSPLALRERLRDILKEVEA